MRLVSPSRSSAWRSACSRRSSRSPAATSPSPPSSWWPCSSSQGFSCCCSPCGSTWNTTRSSARAPVYDDIKADEYWTKRVSEVDQLAAVLSRGLPAYMNEAYSGGETAAVLGCLPSWEGRRVLDLGCGVGRMTVPLVAGGAKVTAFDNSQKMLDLCAQNLEAAGAGGGAELVKGSARELPFEDGGLEVVCCLGVLEHLPADVRRLALEEMIRVTAPQGLILLVVNNSDSTFLRREELYRMERQQNTGYHVSLIRLLP